MRVHLADAVAKGHSKIVVRTVVSDFVVLAVACLNKLPGLEEWWAQENTMRYCHSSMLLPVSVKCRSFNDRAQPTIAFLCFFFF